MREENQIVRYTNKQLSYTKASRMVGRRDRAGGRINGAGTERRLGSGKGQQLLPNPSPRTQSSNPSPYKPVTANSLVQI